MIKLRAVLLFLFAGCILGNKDAFAQKAAVDSNLHWPIRCIGPSGVGRVTTIATTANNPNYIFTGFAGGGAWRTVNSGITWIPVFDRQATLNVASITIDGKRPGVVWLGTGDPAPRNSVGLGEGIYKSVDSGRTWVFMGLKETVTISGIVIDRHDPNIVYAAAQGSPFKAHPERGVYKTIDGGRNWKLILHTNDHSGCVALVMNPENSNELFAAMWEHKRTPWSISSGGPGSGLFKTTDGGRTWKKMGVADGFAAGPIGKIGLSISVSNPRVVYALMEAGESGLYKSEDEGEHWTLVNSDKGRTRQQVLSSRPFYFQNIYCDPQNENKVWAIAESIRLSYDGGKTFSNFKLSATRLHDDHHVFWVSPLDSNLLMDGNDGEFAISRDGGRDWDIASRDIPAGQVYKVNVDDQVPYNVTAGLQDYGTWYGPAYVEQMGLSSPAPKLAQNYWVNIGSGDGFTVLPDRIYKDHVFELRQGGSLGKENLDDESAWPVRFGIGFSENPSGRIIEKRFNWNTPLVYDPRDPNTMYAGTQYLLRSSDGGGTWEKISPDLSTNDSAKLMVRYITLLRDIWPGLKSTSRPFPDSLLLKKYGYLPDNGGLSADNTAAEDYCTITTISPSPMRSGIVWVGTDDGNVQLTEDGGKSWKDLTRQIKGMPAGCYISEVQASAYHTGEAFVVCEDHRKGNNKAYVFRTRDFGKNWEQMVDDSKVDGYAISVLQDPRTENLVFVGTQKGLWISMDNGRRFEKWEDGFPSVAVTDLVINERENDLVIGTFGRSVWVLDDLTPLRDIASDPTILQSKFHLFEVKPTLLYPFRADRRIFPRNPGALQTTNRPYGVAIDFYAKFGKGAPGEDSVSVSVSRYAISSFRDTIPVKMKFRIAQGLNRFYYAPYRDLTEGAYKLSVTVGDFKAQTTFFVRKPE